MGKYYEVANEMIRLVGGEDNITFVTHCMTRVRFEVANEEVVDFESLKKISNVLGIKVDSQIQLIVGPGKATAICETVNEILDNTNKEMKSDKEKLEKYAKENKEKIKSKKKKSKIDEILKTISNIFVPLAPAFIAVGLFAGIEAVMNSMIGSGTITSPMLIQFAGLFGIIRRSVLSYLVIYVGISSAIEFKANMWLGGTVGAVVLLTGMSADTPLMNIFTGQPLESGQGGVIGVVFAVWILSIVEKWLHKKMPESLDLILTSFFSILITVFLTVLLIMPVAGVLSDGMLIFVTKLLEIGGALSGFILAAIWLPAVMLGIHHLMTPVHIELINQTGSTELLPIFTMAGAGQVGAAAAIWYKCKKNIPLVNMVKAGLPAGILGIGEPLIYGVTLPLGKPFITACLGAGFGGAFLGAVGGVGATSIGATGILMIPLIADQKWPYYVIALVVSYIAGFIITFAFGIPKRYQNPETSDYVIE